MTCSFEAFSLDFADGGEVLRQAQYMSVQFCTLLDWFLIKAPFGTRPEFERRVDHQVVAKFLADCVEQHSAPGARDELAVGQ